MARPQKLQRLRHGRIFSKGAFPGIVDTWNWLCDIVESWVGDRDLGGDGCIYVDRTNLDVPVIRLDEVKLGRRLKVSNIPDYGCWRIVGGSVSAEYEDPETGETETATSAVHTIERQYFSIGGSLFLGEDNTTVETFLEAGQPFIAAKIVNLSSPTVNLVGYETFSDMAADSLDRSFSLIPLYELEIPGEGQNVDKLVILTDFRAMPTIQAFELPYTPPPPEESAS